MATFNQSTQAVAFSLVLERFKTTLTDDEKSEFQFTTLDDLQQTMDSIQKRHTTERKLRAMDRLSRFLEAMAEYDKVIQVFVNASQHLAFVWVSSCP